MEVIEIQFTLPGEGAILFGVHVTSDDPPGAYPLDQLVGSPAYFARKAREAQDGR
jgi:hypothetical protein